MTGDERRERVFVFGASGHAKVVIDALERAGGTEVTFLVDDDPAIHGSMLYGYQVRGGRDTLGGGGVGRGIVAIGQNAARMRVAAWLEAAGFAFATALHPSAQLARGATLGPGSLVTAGAVLNADARIGAHVIVNTSASVDHDCVVGDGVHLGPGAVLCGGVTVGQGALIGAGATVVPNVTIGAWAVVGAGTVVTRDLPPNVTAVGVPARIVKERPAGWQLG